MRASRTHGNAHFPCERAHIHFRTESPPSFQENHNLSTRAGAEGHAPNAITHDTDTRKLVSSSARRSARLWDVLTVSELPVPRFAAARALCGRSGKGNELGPEGNRRRGLLCEAGLRSGPYVCTIQSGRRYIQGSLEHTYIQQQLRKASILYIHTYRSYIRLIFNG